jgi:hypothetical protein
VQTCIRLLRLCHQELDYESNSPFLEDRSFLPLFEEAEFRNLAEELYPPTVEFDPVQRTTFIKTFPTWSGDPSAPYASS